MDEIKLISLQNNETKVIMELVKENSKLKSQNKTQMESINGLLKKVSNYEGALKKIVEETNCDDTWDFANRILDGKEMTNLPYRINNN